MDADAGEYFCYEVDCSILCLGYGIALEILVVAVVCVILFFRRSLSLCFFGCVISNLYLSILLTYTEETACSTLVTPWPILSLMR